MGVGVRGCGWLILIKGCRLEVDLFERGWGWACFWGFVGFEDFVGFCKKCDLKIGLELF